MRFALLCLLLCFKIFALSPSVSEMTWENGVSFLRFLEKNKIPLSIFYSMSSEDKESVSDITAGTKYQLLKDTDESVLQILIPITDELQVHIFKAQNGVYKIDFIPIIYENTQKTLNIKIERSISQDIFEYTGSPSLAAAFLRAFRGQGVDFRRINRGDHIIVVYTQKERMGRAFGTPSIEYAMLKSRNRVYSVYKFNDKYYDRDGKQQENFFLTRPVDNARITSGFSLKRYHPILKRYRAHLGVDYGAPRGTPVKAAGEGVVKFIGSKSGYGKTIIIRHAGDYETLYAHLNGFAKGLKVGQRVKQGRLIGYVGSSGLSTGPHLHFGLYQSNKAINPERVLKVVKSQLDKKSKQQFAKFVASCDDSLEQIANNSPLSPKYQAFEDLVEY